MSIACDPVPPTRLRDKFLLRLQLAVHAAGATADNCCKQAITLKAPSAEINE
jgi:hypothetical protein